MKVAKISAAIAIMLCFVVAAPALAANIDKSIITATGTSVDAGSLPPKSIDGTYGTANADSWKGTDGIAIGQTNYLAYYFSTSVNINQIDFTNNRNNVYALGDLDIQTSIDSTDGLDGSWSTVDSIDATGFTPVSGEFSRSVSIAGVDWVRLWMEYQGDGAFGASPRFALTEIDFQGAVTPEPITLALFALGGGALGLTRMRRRKVVA